MVKARARSRSLTILEINICIIQHSICTASKFDCASKLMIDNSECLQKCSGMLITSYETDLEKEIVDRTNVAFKRLSDYMSRNSFELQYMAQDFQGLKN